LIKVETDEGIYGWGEAYSIGPDLSVEPIADYVFEMIKGEDPRRIEYIMLKLYQQFRFPPGAMGLAAFSAVDHALWDISGKAAGLPVYMLLGGNVRDRVRVYHSLGGRDGRETAERAQQLNEEWGFSAFKLGPYRLDPDASRWGRVCAEGARYFAEIRAHAPEEFEFAFDPHAKIGSLSEGDVQRLAEELENVGESIPEWLRNRRKDYDSGEDLHLTGAEIGLTLMDDLSRLKKTRAYRGIRHETHQKVRGQRTRSNGRLGMAVGVKRKK